MNVKKYQRKNRLRLLSDRLSHPWPLYKRVGGISAVVIRANGDREDLGHISTAYAKRWSVGSGR